MDFRITVKDKWKEINKVEQHPGVWDNFHVISNQMKILRRHCFNPFLSFPLLKVTASHFLETKNKQAKKKYNLFWRKLLGSRPKVMYCIEKIASSRIVYIAYWRLTFTHQRLWKIRVNKYSSSAG